MKLKIYRGISLPAAIFLVSMLVSSAVAAETISPSSAVEAPQIFATVENEIITQQEYDVLYEEVSRKRYYHFKPPQAEVASLQREVGDTLVTNIILLSEAKRRGLKPDDEAIAEQLRQHELRYQDNEQWQQARAEALPQITRQLQEESLRERLESLIRKPVKPTTKQLRDYYASHLEKFTVPQQQRVSVILLKVDPSSTAEVWQAAMDKGQELVQSLRAGADFADMAREISDDHTGAQGGDMGYLHGGMLDRVAQQTVDNLPPGGISDPIGLMDGITIFKLTDRQPARQNSFEAAKDRVTEAWLSEQSELKWNTFVAQLKKKTPFQIDESRFLPLAPAHGNGPN